MLLFCWVRLTWFHWLLRFRYSLERRYLQRGLNLRTTHRGPAWTTLVFWGQHIFPELCTPWQKATEQWIIDSGWKTHPFFCGGISSLIRRHTLILCQIYTSEYVAVFDSETHVPSLNVKGILKLDPGNAFQHMRWFLWCRSRNFIGPHNTPWDLTWHDPNSSWSFYALSTRLAWQKFSHVFTVAFFEAKKTSRDRGFRICFFSFGGSVSVQFVGPSAFLQVSPQVNSHCCLRRV